jgi:hypothetical protein
VRPKQYVGADYVLYQKESLGHSRSSHRLVPYHGVCRSDAGDDGKFWMNPFDLPGRMNGSLIEDILRGIVEVAVPEGVDLIECNRGIGRCRRCCRVESADSMRMSWPDHC